MVEVFSRVNNDGRNMLPFFFFFALKFLNEENIRFVSKTSIKTAFLSFISLVSDFGQAQLFPHVAFQKLKRLRSGLEIGTSANAPVKGSA